MQTCRENQRQEAMRPGKNETKYLDFQLSPWKSKHTA